MAWTRAKTAIATVVVVVLTAGSVVLFLNRQNLADWMTVKRAQSAVAQHIAIPIDLTGQYAMRAIPASERTENSSFWGRVPWDFQVFNHVPLHLDGVIILRRASEPPDQYPKEVSGIPVNQKFDTLYVYHCTFYHSPENTPVYNLVFRYQDGESATNTILYGVDVMDFNTLDPDELDGPSGPDSQVAWTGSSFKPGSNRPMHFCLTAIKNPRPGVQVASIDLVSCMNKSAGVIFGMTAGPAGMMH